MTEESPDLAQTPRDGLNSMLYGWQNYFSYGTRSRQSGG